MAMQRNADYCNTVTCVPSTRHNCIHQCTHLRIVYTHPKLIGMLSASLNCTCRTCAASSSITTALKQQRGHTFQGEGSIEHGSSWQLIQSCKQPENAAGRLCCGTSLTPCLAALQHFCCCLFNLHTKQRQPYSLPVPAKPGAAGLQM